MESDDISELFYKYGRRKGLSEYYCKILKANYKYIARRCGPFPDAKALSSLVEGMRERGLSVSWISNIIKTIKHLCTFMRMGSSPIV